MGDRVRNHPAMDRVAWKVGSAFAGPGPARVRLEANGRDTADQLQALGRVLLDLAEERRLQVRKPFSGRTVSDG
jgi:hypothetical protein